MDDLYYNKMCKKEELLQQKHNITLQKEKQQEMCWYRKLSWIYHKASCMGVWFFRFAIIALAMILDIKPVSIQWTSCMQEIIAKLVKVAEVFSSNQGNIIAVAALLWTFTTAMTVYCMGKLDCKYYGIRLSDILLSDKNKLSFFLIMAAMAVDPLILLFSGAFNWFYTSLFVGGLQFLSMVYAALMIYVETSKYTVIEKLRRKNVDELDEKNQLFVNFFKNADYSDRYEADLVMEYLLDDVPDNFNNTKEKVSEITEYILDNEEQKEKRCLFIMNWLSRLNDVKEDKRMEIWKGIFFALIKNFQWGDVARLLDLLDICDQRTSELALWCAACNIYFEQYAMQEWRKQLTRYLLQYGPREKSAEEDEKLILLYREVYQQAHHQYNKNETGNYDGFLRIFDYCITI